MMYLTEILHGKICRHLDSNLRHPNPLFLHWSHTFNTGLLLVLLSSSQYSGAIVPFVLFASKHTQSPYILKAPRFLGHLVFWVWIWLSSKVKSGVRLTEGSLEKNCLFMHRKIFLWRGRSLSHVPRSWQGLLAAVGCKMWVVSWSRPLPRSLQTSKN